MLLNFSSRCFLLSFSGTTLKQIAGRRQGWNKNNSHRKATSRFSFLKTSVLGETAPGYGILRCGMKGIGVEGSRSQNEDLGVPGMQGPEFVCRRRADETGCREKSA